MVTDTVMYSYIYFSERRNVNANKMSQLATHCINFALGV
jgi:hypothetical protein